MNNALTRIAAQSLGLAPGIRPNLGPLFTPAEARGMRFPHSREYSTIAHEPPTPENQRHPPTLRANEKRKAMNFQTDRSPVNLKAPLVEGEFQQNQPTDRQSTVESANQEAIQQSSAWRPGARRPAVRLRTEPFGAELIAMGSSRVVGPDRAQLNEPEMSDAANLSTIGNKSVNSRQPDGSDTPVLTEMRRRIPVIQVDETIGALQRIRSRNVTLPNTQEKLPATESQELEESGPGSAVNQSFPATQTNWKSRAKSEFRRRSDVTHADKSASRSRPMVQVNIDRIEVRAVVPAQPASAKRRERNAAITSLESYLAERSKGAPS